MMVTCRAAVAIITLLGLMLMSSATAGEFWRAEWAVPDRIESNELLLRPLQSSDAERFFHSYMGSQAWLYQRLGWSWPTDKSSMEQNQSMVKLHLKQQQEHKAYTYIVVDQQRDMLVGAVYFVPVGEERGRSGTINANSYNAEITWWLTEPAVNRSLHNNLFALLTDWLQSGWPWSQVLFPVAESNQPSRAVLENSAARKVGYNRDSQELFYSYSLARK